MTEAMVRIQKVETEIEAELLTAALRSGGVRCNYAVSPWVDPTPWDLTADSRAV
jgi:hypothetical protein